ncbi:hypothetical protein AOLI_G00316350 [Acnodon oligacanthus]
MMVIHTNKRVCVFFLAQPPRHLFHLCVVQPCRLISPSVLQNGKPFKEGASHVSGQKKELKYLENLLAYYAGKSVLLLFTVAIPFLQATLALVCSGSQQPAPALDSQHATPALERDVGRSVLERHAERPAVPPSTLQY